MFYTVSGNVLDTDCSIICAPFSSSGVPEGAVSSELMNDKRFRHEVEECSFSDELI